LAAQGSHFSSVVDLLLALLPRLKGIFLASDVLVEISFQELRIHLKHVREKDVVIRLRHQRKADNSHGTSYCDQSPAL